MAINGYPFQKTGYQQTCFRNIYTAQPSQDLYDDIVDPEDYENLFDLEMESSLIDRSEPHNKRTFQYGVSNELYTGFNPPWKEGRFGDGKSYGVFYTAEDKITSYLEAYWHFTKWAYNMHTQSSKDWIESDRKVFEIDIESSNFASLIEDSKSYDSLVSEDYTFCQRIALEAMEANIEGLRVPSARNKQGVCVPIFQHSVLRDERFIKYVKFSLNVKTGEMRITGDISITFPYDYQSIIKTA